MHVQHNLCRGFITDVFCNLLSYGAVRLVCFFFFSSRRRHTRSDRDWSSDVCSSDLLDEAMEKVASEAGRSFDPRVVEVLQERYVELERKAQSYNAEASRLSREVKIEDRKSVV